MWAVLVKLIQERANMDDMSGKEMQERGQALTGK